MRSIHACSNGLWSIATWKKEGGEDPKVSPFRCKSWRHAGECRDACGACDFARISKAIGEHRDWTYCVLTYPSREWPNLDDLFRAGKDHWNALRKRLVKRYGKFLYIQTWEVHRSGVPHVNIIISSETIYDVAANAANWEDATWLKRELEACGFGWKCWAEPMRDGASMAGYLTKLGLELAGAAYKDQVPVNAPPHFRRIRSSKGLLPPRTKDDTITGRLFFVPVTKLMDGMDGEEASSSSAR